MLRAATTEWFPKFGASWQVTHPPFTTVGPVGLGPWHPGSVGAAAQNTGSSLIPDTPVIGIGNVLKRISPRAMEARFGSDELSHAR
jgi:hypothetical protein